MIARNCRMPHLRFHAEPQPSFHHPSVTVLRCISPAPPPSRTTLAFPEPLYIPQPGSRMRSRTPDEPTTWSRSSLARSTSAVVQAMTKGRTHVFTTNEAMGALHAQRRNVGIFMEHKVGTQ